MTAPFCPVSMTELVHELRFGVVVVVVLELLEESLDDELPVERFFKAQAIHVNNMSKSSIDFLICINILCR